MVNGIQIFICLVTFWTPYIQKTNKPLRLAKNARVMITKNICVSDGLANCVMGRIVGFIDNDNKEFSRILIKCDLPTVGRLHRVNCRHCHGQDTVYVVHAIDIA
jgi:hypothetical protein